MNIPSPLLRFRIALSLFIAGLVLSGVTAFPLVHELRLLASLVEADWVQSITSAGLRNWIFTIRDGLEDAAIRYPWMAYGTDWLGFGHLIIAMFFIPPLRDPLGNRPVLIVGVIACISVIPFAIIAGAVRQIPIFWRLIDCSFGVFGMLPLIYCLRLLPDIRRSLSR